MTAVVKWSGLEARLLRQARRMSVREFASHLGVNDAAVSNWERRGVQARLRYQTQQILDVDLSRAAKEIQARFGAALEAASQPAAKAGSSDTGGTEDGDLGERSSSRSHQLLEIMTSAEPAAHYLSPKLAETHLEEFMRSRARVLLLQGPAGVGKSALARHTVRYLTGADVQLHAADGWYARQVALAAEILRYASCGAGPDPLLTLEASCRNLHRPLLVVIDAIADHTELHHIAGEIDRILRQVLTHQLRFLLLVRTPPEVDLSAHPVLMASSYTTADGAVAQPALDRWSVAEAAAAWQAHHVEGMPTFRELPHHVQQLARLPLYSRLMTTLGATGQAQPVNPATLIGACVDAVLRNEGVDPPAAIDDMIALAARQLPDLQPSAGSKNRRQDTTAQIAAWPPLTRQDNDGELIFSHDVMREYFLAFGLVRHLATDNRPATVTSALNHLAEQATTSATARNVLTLVTHLLDATDRGLLTNAIGAATISATTTLPLILDASDDRSTGFVTPDVLRRIAQRCALEAGTLDLAKAVIAHNGVVPALGAEFQRWLLAILRSHHTRIWADLITLVEHHLDAADIDALAAAADLDDPDQASFFARFYYLFTAEQTSDLLTSITEHSDWRVRAALVDGLQDPRAPRTDLHRDLTERLVRDLDYKVRAAVTAVVPTTGDVTMIRQLLSDENWHVRNCLLHAILDTTAPLPAGHVLELVADVLDSDSSWTQAPSHVAATAHRLALLHGWQTTVLPDGPARTALFRLLRESRTGAVQLPRPTGDRIVQLVAESTDPILRREAAAIHDASDAAGPLGAELGSRSQEYRRFRGQRLIQLALDTPDLERAVALTRAAAQAGLDLVEVGDPLIKSAGAAAIAAIKQASGDAIVVAEMMSADWGRDQVVIAAEAGADVVLLIGPASTASVSAAVAAGHRLGLPVVLDVPSHARHPWIRDMERAGVDGLTITTNIDLGVAGRDPMTAATTLRRWTRLPVSVSGGFSPTDHNILRSPEWDILIVGRSIADAVDPLTAASRFAAHVNAYRPESL
ncbi:orotidine 5'-phosphate decarboxylase / HUMPS family protein [Pilimelia columellifera]|uniref:Orotidine 5'-phosphate decarboxylase domain-containing protein n=1 Tax=Pilimelia columellifera subsp. columellifera TaxID=706583 RepID=A0ABN3NHM8_9ACTN